MNFVRIIIINNIIIYDGLIHTANHKIQIQTDSSKTQTVVGLAVVHHILIHNSTTLIEYSYQHLHR